MIKQQIRNLASELDVYLTKTLKVFEEKDGRLIYQYKTIDALYAGLVKMQDVKKALNRAVDTKQPFNFKTKPFKHQAHIFYESRNKENYALFMEQGTGKSKVVVDTASYMFENNMIDGIMVIAPKGVHSDWISYHFPEHKPDRVASDMAYWSADNKKSEAEHITKMILPPERHQMDRKLKVLAINIDGVNVARGYAVVETFLKNNRCLLVVDESSRIKNTKAKRTKKVLKLGKLANYKRILTGTPVTKSPLDLYSQMSFLSPDILGFNSFVSFRARYAILRDQILSNGGRYQMVVGFRPDRLDEITQLIAPYSYRILAKECLDLPPLTFSKSSVIMNTEQLRIYNELAEDLYSELAGAAMTVPTLLTKLLRLSQITGGFFPSDEGESLPVGDSNPKLERLLDTIKEIDESSKVIIWARFKPELDVITEALAKEYGENTVVDYHGRVTNKRREYAKETMRDEESQVRFFVGNPRAGGTGLNLTAANFMIFFSSGFDLDDRLQAEKRSHRIGQKKHVHIIDIIAKDSMDETIIESLKNKKDIADVITGDIRREV